MSKKPLLAFNREADENDSRGVKRDAGVVIKGHKRPVRLNRAVLDQSLFMGPHYHYGGNGAARFQSETLTLTIQDNVDSLTLHTVAKRGEAPVTAGFEFDKDGDDLILRRGYVKHLNSELDDQHINSPKMLRFALEAAYKEVRRVVEPEWLKSMAGAYFHDQEHDTKTQAEFLPTIAIEESADGSTGVITYTPPINQSDFSSPVAAARPPIPAGYTGH